MQNALGLYVQDQWSVRRLTLNLGLSNDYLNGSAPSHQLPAGTFVPARTFEATKNSPDWKDLNPRLGGAYDLFGNGVTAVKAFLGRYILFEPITGITTATSPANLIATSATRNWTDNGDYIPQEAELGPLSRPRSDKSCRTRPTRMMCCTASGTAATAGRVRCRSSTSSVRASA